MQKNKNSELPSRYKDIKSMFHYIDNNSGIITSNSNYIKCILFKDKKSIQAVDFEGGPMLYVGDTLNNKMIKSIKSIYYVELE